MKRKIYFITLFLTPLVAVFPQINEKTIEKTGTYSSYMNLAAREYVKLKYPFKYTGNSFHAKVDENIICNVVYDNSATVNPDLRELNTALPVGSTEVNIDVTPSGAASFQLPVFTPPGTAGMQPNISLVYNSQAGNSVVGFGIDISGLSNITRVTKNIYSDGSVEGIQYKTTDKLALDGNPMVLSSGTYGVAGSIYGTENETFSRITAYGNAGSGPQYFIVETKDGKKIEYGNTTDSRVLSANNATVRAWLINRLSDQYGNFIDFKYIAGGLIKTIEYTGNSNTNSAAYNSINFYYEARSDNNTAYIAGTEVGHNKILYAIRVKCENKVVREYNFTYKYDAYSRLSKIKEFNANNEPLNETHIIWGEYSNAISSVSSLVLGNTYGSVSDLKWLTGDVNSDGLTDLMCIYKVLESAGIPLCEYLVPFIAQPIETGSTSFSSNGTPLKLDYFKSNSLSPKTCNNNVYMGKITENDINEIISVSYQDNGVIQDLNVQANGVLIDGNIVLNSSDKMPAMALNDFNNDGLDDLLYIEDSKSGSAYPGAIVYHYAKNSSILNNKVNLNFNLSNSVKHIICADFNNDGLKDILLIKDDGHSLLYNNGASIDNNGCYVASFSSPVNSNFFNSKCQFITPGDFNGDKLTDILYFDPETSRWLIGIKSISPGVTFSSSLITAVTPILDDPDTDKDNGKDNAIVIDFNYDGKPDLITFDAKYKWVHNGGSHWKELETFDVKWYTLNGLTATLVKESSSTNEDDTPAKYYHVGDFNGDGRQDMLNYGFDCYSGSDFTTKWRTYQSFNTNFEKGLVKTILDGMNRRTDIVYRPLSYAKTADGNDFYTRGSNLLFPLISAQLPLYCVQSISIQDAQTSSSVSKTEYLYSGLKIHRQGLGLLCFNYLSQKNQKSNANVRTQSIVNDYYKIGKKITYRFNYSGNSVLGYSELNYTTEKPAKSIINLISSSKEVDNTTNTNVTTTYSYHTDKNLKSETKDYGGSYWDKTEYGSYVIAGSYIANKPQLVTVTRKCPDDVNFVNKTYCTYDAAKGHLLTQINNYQVSGKQVTTTYSNYDSYGFPENKKVEATGTSLETYTESYTYDSKRRFMLSKTDVMGTSSATYDPVYGNTLTETGITGLKTTYTYDNWGRITKQTLPTGKTVNFSTQWDLNNSNIPNACFYEYTTSAGSPWVKTWYDKLGRPLRAESIGFNNISLYSTTKYDNAGRVSEQSEYTGGVLTNKVTYGYSTVHNMLTSESLFSGLTSTYTYADHKITTVTDGKTYSKTFDNRGGIASITEPSPGGTINYKYYSHGQPKEIISPASTISMTYDAVGNQLTLTDPDAGTINYAYDAYGRLTSQTDHKGIVTQMKYNSLGQLYQKILNSKTTTYEYYPSGSTKGLTKTITDANGSFFSYEYDAYGRTLKTTQHIDATINDIIFQYTYNSYGHLTKVTYPGSFVINRYYDSYGNLTSVKNGSTAIWALNTATATSYKYTLGNGIVTEKKFDSKGMLSSIVSSNRQNITYSFNPVNGLLNSRTDVLNSVSEAFTYDGLYRLTNWNVTKNGVVTKYSQYYKTDKSGNINTKSGIGTFNYTGGTPHQLTQLAPASGSPVPTIPQSLTFNDFNKVNTITENGNELSFMYGPDEERIKTTLKNGTNTTCTSYFGGLYEKKAYSGANVEYWYIPAGDGITAVYRNARGDAEMLYLLKDHLGTITGVTSEDGQTIQEFNFDPWGRLRNPTDWSYANVPAMNYIPRGFTSHEHLPEFNLINMNGRVYDPMLSMFISPDNYLQAPDMTQNYNRYAYCFNNPLSYTDPTGNFGVAGAIIGGILGGYQGYQIASSKGYSMNSIEMAAYINGGSLIGSAAGFFGASGGIIGAGAGGATSGGGFAALNGGDAADIAGGMATGWLVGVASYAAAQGIVYGVGAVINYMPIIPAGTSYGQKWVWNGTNDHWISLGNYLNLSSNAISQTASYAGTGGVMWANVYLASYSGSSSYFDRPTVFYASAGGAGGEWGGIFDRLYDYYFTIPQYSDFPTNVPMATGTIPIPGIGKIGSYSQLVKMTRGYKGAIQAHHLVEVRHLKGLLMSSKNAPSVILSKADHAALTKTLRDLLPYGEAYTKPQIINAYKKAYSNFPEWVDIVVKFLQ